MKRKFLLLLTNVLLLFILAGCAKAVNYNNVKDYADPIVNSILTSINNLDYNTFSSYLSDDMKESYTLSAFQSETANIINNEGTFESAEFYAGEERGNYIYLIYDVKFSSNDETTPISITFEKNDEEHKVQQFYFDSNLSES